MIKNPMSIGISQIGKKLPSLEFDMSNFFPSIIVAVILSVIIIVFIVLWPYGWVAVIEDMIRSLMRDTTDSIKKTKTVVEAMPFGFALVVFLLVWIPFALLCLPFAIFGVIGKIAQGMRE